MPKSCSKLSNTFCLEQRCQYCSQQAGADETELSSDSHCVFQANSLLSWHSQAEVSFSSLLVPKMQLCLDMWCLF